MANLLMDTTWIYRINILIPESNKAALNALWTLLAPGGDAEAQTFGVPLSATGDAPATHLGVSSAGTAVMRAHITDTFAAELADAIISIQDKDANDWEQLLAANGMKVIQPPLLEV